MKFQGKGQFFCAVSLLFFVLFLLSSNEMFPTFARNRFCQEDSFVFFVVFKSG